MVSPTLATPSPPSFNVPVFTNVMAGLEASDVVVLPGAVTSAPMVGVPLAVAVFGTLPASMSIAVSV